MASELDPPPSTLCDTDWIRGGGGVIALQLGITVMCCGIFGSLLLPAVDNVSASEVVLKDLFAFLGQTSPEYSTVASGAAHGKSCDYHNHRSISGFSGKWKGRSWKRKSNRKRKQKRAVRLTTIKTIIKIIATGFDRQVTQDWTQDWEEWEQEQDNSIFVDREVYISQLVVSLQPTEYSMPPESFSMHSTSSTPTTHTSSSESSSQSLSSSSQPDMVKKHNYY